MFSHLFLNTFLHTSFFHLHFFTIFHVFHIFQDFLTYITFPFTYFLHFSTFFTLSFTGVLHCVYFFFPPQNLFTHLGLQGSPRVNRSRPSQDQGGPSPFGLAFGRRVSKLSTVTKSLGRLYPSPTHSLCVSFAGKRCGPSAGPTPGQSNPRPPVTSRLLACSSGGNPPSQRRSGLPRPAAAGGHEPRVHALALPPACARKGLAGNTFCPATAV